LIPNDNNHANELLDLDKRKIYDELTSFFFKEVL